MVKVVLATASQEIDSWITSTFPEVQCLGRATSWQGLASLLKSNDAELAVVAGAALTHEGPAQNIFAAFGDNVAKYFDGPVLMLLPDAAAGVAPALAGHNVMVHHGDKVFSRRLANELDAVIRAIEASPTENADKSPAAAKKTDVKPRSSLYQGHKVKHQTDDKTQ